MMEHIPWLSGVFERPVRVENGHVLVPQEPGAGTDIGSAALTRFAVP
jgi:L-alanine-DL-glutamate epimerase-like enolase superfamily enzyme